MDTTETELLAKEAAEKVRKRLVSSVTTMDGEIVGPGNEKCSYCEALHTFVKKGPKATIYLCDACQWEQTAPYFVRREVTAIDFTKGKANRSVELEHEVVERATGMVVARRRRIDKAYAVSGMKNAEAGHVL